MLSTQIHTWTPERRTGWSTLAGYIVITVAMGACDNTTIDSPLAEAQQALVTGYQAMLIPAYISSSDGSAWAAAMPDKIDDGHGANYRGYYVVNGPTPGPPTARDSNLIDHVNALQARQIRVLGYVTALGSNAAAIKADIDRWRNNPVDLGLALDGIFFDDAELQNVLSVAQIEWLGNYAQSLFNKYVPGKVVFNWGGADPAMEQYVDCQLLRSNGSTYQNEMHWVTFEGSRSAFLGTVWSDSTHGWVHKYNSWRFANLIYGVSPNEELAGGPGLHIQTQLQDANAALVYATDALFGPNVNTWGRIAADPSLWTNEQTLWYGFGTNWFVGKALGSETFAYNVSQCPLPSL